MRRIATLLLYSEEDMKKFEELVDFLKEKYVVEPLEDVNPPGERPVIYKISLKE